MKTAKIKIRYINRYQISQVLKKREDLKIKVRTKQIFHKTVKCFANYTITSTFAIISQKKIKPRVHLQRKTKMKQWMFMSL